MVIENKKITLFSGNYTEYIRRKNETADCHKAEFEKQIIVLENRLSEVIGKLSMPSEKDDMEALDAEYHRILKELRLLRGKCGK